MPALPGSSVPQFLVLKVPVSSVAVTTARDISAVSAAMSPAPIWQPERVGLVENPWSFSSEPAVRSPASSAAILAAMTASSVSRAMTLVALR